MTDIATQSIGSPFPDALPGCQACALTITIAAMETLPGEMLAPVMGWISTLPYPWCAARLPGVTATEILPLQQVLRTLVRTGG